MARNLAYYMDPEEEERKRLLLEQEFGPPAPQNLGVAPVPRLPIDATTPRRTDGNYADFHDAYQDEEPSDEELAADVAHEAPPEPAEHPLDILLQDPGTRPNPYEELAQAPAPVDKTAASVSAEQRLTKGIDTEEEHAWADDLLGEVQKRVLDKPELGSSPLTEKAAEFASGSLERKDGFSRQKQAELASAAYGDESPPSTRWEDEFNTRHGSNRLTDDQIRRRGAAIGLVSSLFTDDTSAGQRWADAQHRSNAGYDEGLSKARDRDKQNTRISRGLASAIAATGNISPEEAGKLTYGDPTVKAFSSGMYSQGGRAEGQALGREKAQMDLAADLYKSAKVDDRVRGLAMLSGLVQLGSAEIRAQALSQLSPEDMQQVAASWMQSGLKSVGANLSPQKAAAVLAGDRSELTPEQAAKADALAPNIKAGVADPKVRGPVMADNLKAGVNAEQKKDTAVQLSVERAKADPKYALQWEREWNDAAAPLKNALEGWKVMSPGAKQALAQWTQSNKDGSSLDLAHLGDQWNKYNEMTPEDQIHVSRVLGAINSYVKAQGGSAVTNSEWDRIAHRVGMATGTWAPFNNPEVIGQFLKDAANAMNANMALYHRHMD